MQPMTRTGVNRLWPNWNPKQRVLNISALGHEGSYIIARIVLKGADWAVLWMCNWIPSRTILRALQEVAGGKND